MNKAYVFRDLEKELRSADIFAAVGISIIDSMLESSRLFYEIQRFRLRLLARHLFFRLKKWSMRAPLCGIWVPYYSGVHAILGSWDILHGLDGEMCWFCAERGLECLI